ncbi:MAG TPA: hypothetical protein V6D47_19255 [Oscillatoriaceae cyanobacterium]
MKRSTAVFVAIATLLLGSGFSGLTFVKPALDQQGKLTAQKRQLTQTQLQLKEQVDALQTKLKGMAMDSIAYFDLRNSPDRDRAVEAKTVETLNSLNEIFNDDHLRVVELDPDNTAAPAPTPTPSGAPSAKANPGASPSPGAIDLTRRSFDIEVHGEYSNVVSAITAIQALPKAISIDGYEVHLIHDPLQPEAGGDGTKPADSPTALALTFQVTITYLMSGGPPEPSPSPNGHLSALPAHWAGQAIEWVFGEPADAAVASATAATGGPCRFVGVAFEHGHLAVRTLPGVPRYDLASGKGGMTLTLQGTHLEHPGVSYAINQGGIKKVTASAVNGQVRLQIETDGHVKLVAHEDASHHLELAAASAAASPAEAASNAARPTPSALPRFVQKLPPERRSPGAARRPELRLAKITEAPAASANLPETLHLQRSLTSRYAFPIDRAHSTGRLNPFKPLIALREPPVKLSLPKPVPIPPLPKVPGNGSDDVSAASAGGAAYVLEAVLIGSGEPPMAVIAVNGATYDVGLNRALPGNARVKAIDADRVVLSTPSGDLPLPLKK